MKKTSCHAVIMAEIDEGGRRKPAGRVGPGADPGGLQAHPGTAGTLAICDYLPVNECLGSANHQQGEKAKQDQEESKCRQVQTHGNPVTHRATAEPGRRWWRAWPTRFLPPTPGRRERR